MRISYGISDVCSSHLSPAVSMLIQAAKENKVWLIGGNECIILNKQLATRRHCAQNLLSFFFDRIDPRARWKQSVQHLHRCVASGRNCWQGKTKQELKRYV